MRYRVKGILRLHVKRVIEIEVDETVESDYIVDAFDAVTDSRVKEVEALYPDYIVEVYSNKSMEARKITLKE